MSLTPAPQITAVSPTTVVDDGGDMLTLTGTFVLGDSYQVSVLSGTNEFVCYSGVSGEGSFPVAKSTTELKAVIPPLPAGGAYTLRLRSAAGAQQGGDLANVLTVRNRSFSGRSIDLRKSFPPSLAVGPRLLRNTDELSRTDVVENTAATFNAIANQEASVGVAFSFTPTGFSDPDSGPGPVTWIGINLPSWASVNPSTGEITGTPALGDVGTFVCAQIGVNDGQAITGSTLFDIVVVLETAYAAGTVAGGATIMIGSTSIASEDATNANSWVAKANAGVVEWAALLGSDRPNRPLTMSVDPVDGGVLVAGFQEYGSPIGDGDIRFYDKDEVLQETLSGNIADAGGFEYGWAAKYSGTGALVWAKKFLDVGGASPAPTSDQSITPHGIAVTPDGDVLVTGNYGTVSSPSSFDDRLLGEGETDEQTITKKTRGVAQFAFRLDRTTGDYILDSKDTTTEKVNSLTSNLFVRNTCACSETTFSADGETVALLENDLATGTSTGVLSYTRASELTVPDNNPTRTLLACKWDENHDAMWAYEIRSSPSIVDFADEATLAAFVISDGSSIFFGEALAGANNDVEFTHNGSNVVHTSHGDLDLWIARYGDDEVIDWTKSIAKGGTADPRIMATLADEANDAFYVFVRNLNNSFGEVTWGTGEGGEDSFDWAGFQTGSNQQGFIAKFKLSDGTFLRRVALATNSATGQALGVPNGIRINASGNIEVVLTLVDTITLKHMSAGDETLSTTTSMDEDLRVVEFDSDLDYVSDVVIFEDAAADFGVNTAAML